MNPIDSRPDSPLSEADIQAYADGTLTPERAAYLRDYLGKDPAEARRVAFYGRLNVQIQQAFQTTDELVTDCAADRRGSLHRLTTALRDSKAVKTIAVLALVLASASGWLAATQAPAQALSNAAVMALAETAAGQFSAASATRTSLSAPDLAAAGLRLVEQRTLALGPFQRASEFVYLNADGRPVVLISSLALLGPSQPQWAARRIGDIRLLTWTAQRQRFVVAGNAPTHGLMRAADLMTMR
ncbi:anti-sigma factor family protein [Paraburkholderia sp. SIMBA_030]|uniref:anti-sigma factor family protein n=1 Tax=Paraburkholderia sp. SIMBA_030 TaxID=3085773 RepID=UPI00397B5E60